MKKLLLFFCFFSIFSSIQKIESNDQKQNQHQCPPDLDEEGIAVLSQFAGILGNFLNILQAPNNSVNVGNSIGGMVHGLANILQIATKSGKNLEEYIRSDEFKKEIRLLLKSKGYYIENI